MSWGVFPLLFVAHGVSLEGVGLIKAVYPVIWGAGQILTGSLADRIGRERVMYPGVALTIVGAALVAFTSGYVLITLGTFLVGIGWAAAKGHLADIGGMTAGGYNPNTTEVWQEAFRIPPVKIYESGVLRRDMWDLVAANIRFDYVMEDIKSMVGACQVGSQAPRDEDG